MLSVGIKGRQNLLADKTNTARAMGSGDLDVFGSPSMIALMEKTAWMSVASSLTPGCTTVGTRIQVKHMSPTALGKTVRCEAELLEIDGNRLVFSVAAYDDAGLIGEGKHERFIINKAKLQEKANSRTKPAAPTPNA